MAWLSPDRSTFMTPEQQDSRVRLLEEIKNSYITLRSEGEEEGRRVRLCETVIAGLDSYLDENVQYLPLLSLSVPSDKQLKQILSLFGVTVEKDIHFLLYCLRSLQRQSSQDMEVLSYIYEQIQFRFDELEDFVR
ncbi:hypothetical protein SLS59_003828 [Nothophoma quercina]|uniref:Uncharacterized protein n=1 Tax=Nothophoma quercina TaxID=749835 RepID=A0ABR3RKE6_9PLEO